jgi:hypothetical protein
MQLAKFLTILSFVRLRSEATRVGHLRGRDLFAYYPAKVTSSTSPPCPVPTSGLCTEEYSPVECGANSCFYSNQCQALRANFSAGACAVVATAEVIEEPAASSCPSPSPAFTCPNDYSPVTCGKDSCMYDNICLALASNFTEVECEEASTPPNVIGEPAASSCPTPSPAVTCPNDYNPVTCGENSCMYSNICLALASNFTELECEKASKPPEVIGEPEASSCPTPSPAWTCPNDFTPVECGEDSCVYGNLCLALASNYAEVECESFTPPEVIGEPVTSICPSPAPNATCPDDYSPVECGEDSCLYDNLCLALLSNYTKNDCADPVETTNP